MDERRNWFLTIIGGLIVAFIVLAVEKSGDRARDDVKAKPSLTFEKLESGNGFVDVLARSQSSQPFLIHTGKFRIIAIVRDAPRKIKPPDPEPPREKSKKEQRKERREEKKRKKLAKNRDRDTAPAPTRAIDPDEVDITPPSNFEMNTWYPLEEATFEVAPYSAERIRVTVSDTPKAGARYRVEVKIPYGDGKNPDWLLTPRFEIDVVAE